MSKWDGRKVLVTGHTGFKGGWLATWLAQLGAEVHGYALDPEGEPNLFDCARVAGSLASDTRADISDLGCLLEVVKRTKPEVTFHLAAQPLVLAGHLDPQLTWQTNVMGTVNVLEAARNSETIRAVVVVTTDKVYEPQLDGRPVDESDRLVGHDPYSASKASAELVAQSYRNSFPSNLSGDGLRIATARAGNVIGGGDWSRARLVPDCVRSLMDGRPIELRRPDAVRPWQHVFDPLAGYVLLAERLLASDGCDFASGWNFGPPAEESATVREVVGIVCRTWGSELDVTLDQGHNCPSETALLRLDSSKALKLLGWQPQLEIAQAVKAAIAWYKAHLDGHEMDVFSREQIVRFLDGVSGGHTP